MSEELSLDPENWAEFAAQAHTIVDELIDFLAKVRERPAWQPAPLEIKAALRDPQPPLHPTPLPSVYREYAESIRPYQTGNVHPRFWGWVCGSAAPVGVIADLLASGSAANIFGANETGAHVEAQVLSWFKTILGFPRAAGGLLVMNGSAANQIAITVARNANVQGDVLQDGLTGLKSRPVLYCSDQTHNSIDKAAMILGLGASAVRSVPTDEHDRIRTDLLRAMVREDRQAGLQPFCIVGSCGTVNTGAIDDLRTLREIASAEGLWFHIDAAIGAALCFSERLRPLAAGLESADSVAFDLHKWMNMPYDVGAVLIRDAEAQMRSYSPPAPYLATLERGIAAAEHRYGSMGPDLSRGFRALKIWMSLKTYGLARFARIVEQNVEQARYLAGRIQSSPQLELMAQPQTCVVAFRYHEDGLSEQQLNGLNRELLMRMQESGVAAPSGTVLRGRFAIRAAIVSHRTRMQDMDIFLEKTLEIGAALAQEHSRSTEESYA